MFAIATIDQFCEAYPEKAETLEWLLRPRRHALLSELGRIAKPRTDAQGVLRWSERDVSRMIGAALEVAEAKPSAKAGVAMIRERRRTLFNREDD